jgi:putative transcriptional regulator
MECICYILGGGYIMKNNVKVARIKADLTQQQLADEVGITRQTVSLIEKGKYNPSLKLCLQICYAVHVKLDDLFWVEKEEFE